MRSSIQDAEAPVDTGPGPDPFAEMVGHDPAWLRVLEIARRGARTSAPVLITGETGTGKELVARAIHAASNRAKGPFVAINSGTLLPHLLTSELFGYEPGMFTGGNPKGRTGLIQSADGGTLFFDEVSELPYEAQVALLRTLQEGEVVRVGGHKPIPVDVRIVAATNRDLREMVRQGKFRQDLFYRLSVIPVHLPPLRERPRDIIPLIVHGYRRLGRPVPRLPLSSWRQLFRYDWPGNVRELLNLVQLAVTLDEDPAELLPLPPLPKSKAEPGPAGEETAIRDALDACGGNVSAAARTLGMGRSTLYRKLELYGIRLKRQVE